MEQCHSQAITLHSTHTRHAGCLPREFAKGQIKHAAAYPAVLGVSYSAAVEVGAWVQRGLVAGVQDQLAALDHRAQDQPDLASSYAAQTVTQPLVEHTAAHARHAQSCTCHQSGSNLLSTCSSKEAVNIMQMVLVQFWKRLAAF